ncbi:AbiV family abortive infection protein [Flaviaesturariibacter amylovorans]|uniref:AbiV family abortive infection protein n=1 Tax=Flaviaesturariibacter amylovorans TaxID=1084520 RepID=A0ABP8HU11_9BACT
MEGLSKKAAEALKKDWYWLDCDFMSGSCFAYENARKHFKYSDLSANEGDYGFAISHLVLGTEEMIKSILLLCSHANRYFLSTDEKEKIFSRHDFKHLNIKELLTSLSELRIESHHQNPFESIDSGCNNKFQTTAHFLGKGLMLGGLDDSEISQLLSVLNEANDYKNRGFYVDYRYDWKNPEDLGEKEYLQFNTLATKLTGFIKPIFELPITDDRLQRFLEGRWI